VRTWLDAPGSFDGVFPARARRLGLAWAVCAGSFATVVSAFVDGQTTYIAVFVVVASGAFTVPALAVSWIAALRAPDAYRRAAVVFCVAVALTCATGIGMLIGLATGWGFGNAVGPAIVAVTGGLFVLTSVGHVRSSSGWRALIVDGLDAAMGTVVIVAPIALVWGEDVLTAAEAWYTVPAAVAIVAFVFALHWVAALVARGGRGTGLLALLALIFVGTGAADAGVQVAQGLSGFTLPAPPLIAIHAVTASMVLLLPLHLPRTAPPGLGRLPAHAQVRGGGLAAALMLAGLPILAVALWLDDRRPAAVPLGLAAAALLLALGAVRQMATTRETQRLYGRLEQASEQRRRLLADLLQQADDDRHRVAGQLHEHAVAAHSTFVSLAQELESGARSRSRLLAGASTLIGADLARHASALRHLLLAVRPLESEGRGARTLVGPVHAYIDGLYGDGRSPRLSVSVPEGPALDWVCETIVLRIVQEAVRNIWRHSEATTIDVAVDVTEDGIIDLRVVDDGIGFRPEEAHGSGIEAMRSFAALAAGELHITSVPGVGTTVVARLVDPGVSGGRVPTPLAVGTPAR
jgi:signal transduction histidine kinase